MDCVYDFSGRYGFGVEVNWMPNSFFYSSGISLVELNEDGDMELSFGGEVNFASWYDTYANGAKVEIDAFTQAIQALG